MSEGHFTSPGVSAGRPVWKLSGWGPRFVAQFIDGLIINVPVFALLSSLGEIETTTGDGTAFTHVDGTAVLVWLGVATLYYVWTMTAWNGQTIGKRAANIRVVREDGEPMDAWFAFKREILIIQLFFGLVCAFVLYIPTLLNYLWPLWDEKNQAFHDKMVGSRVVLEDPVSVTGPEALQPQGTSPMFPTQPPVPQPGPPAPPAPAGYYAPPTTTTPIGPPAPPVPPAPPLPPPPQGAPPPAPPVPPPAPPVPPQQ